MLLLFWTAFLISMEGIRAACSCDISHMTTTAFTVYVNSGSPGNYTGQYNPAPWLEAYGLLLTQYIDFGVPTCSDGDHDPTKCRENGAFDNDCCALSDNQFGTPVWASCADGYVREWGTVCYTHPTDGWSATRYTCKPNVYIASQALEWVGSARIGNLEIADDIVLVKAQSPNLALVDNNPDGFDETFIIKATANDGTVCSSPEITIHYSCANANFKITHGNPDMVSVKLAADISTPFATIQAGKADNSVAVQGTLLWIVTSGCFKQYQLVNPSDAALQIDATTGVITWSVTPELGASYTTQVQMNVPDRDPYTSPVITIVVACLATNILGAAPQGLNTIQTAIIGDTEIDFSIPKFSAPFEDACAITYAIVSPSLSGGYSSFVVSAVTNTASFRFTDNSTPQVLNFTLSVSAAGDTTAAQTFSSSYTLKCGLKSVTAAVDTSEQSLQFEVGSASVFYFEFAEFVLTPANGCKVTSYTLSNPNDLASPVGPDANGKYKIKVIDSTKAAVYKFTITAVIEGGFSYTTAEKTITVLDCGPQVPTITDKNSKSHTLRIGELDSTYWELPAATYTPTRCPIEKVAVCSKSKGSPDCSKLPTGLGYTSTSEYAASIFLESAHWNVTDEYTFYLQYTMKGGAVRYTLEKVISVICPATVNIERDIAPQERDFYVLEKSETTSYYYNWQNFRTKFRVACPVLSYGVFQIDSDGNEIFPVEFDSSFGVQEDDQKGWFRVKIQNQYLKDLRQIDFNFTATILGGNVYKSLKTIHILERPQFNFTRNADIEIVQQIEPDGNVTGNEPPQFKEEALEKVSVEKGQQFKYTSPTAHDPEQDDFNITMTESSEGVDAVFTRNDNKSFSLSFETDQLNAGSYQFTFSLNDSISESAKTYTLEVEVLAEPAEEKGTEKSNFVFNPDAFRTKNYRPPPGAAAKSNKTEIEETIKKEVNLPRSQFKIGTVDVLGQVSIEFSQNMIVQKDLDFSLVFEVTIQSELSGERQFGTFEQSKSAGRKMQVADNEDGPQLGLSWSLSNHTSRKIGLQLQYDNPYLVSQGEGKHDVLSIKVKNISLFQSEDTGLAMRLEDQPKLEDDDAFQSAIPKQTEDYESIYATKDQASSLQDQVDFLSKSNIVIVLLAQGSFQQFWGLLRTSQMLLFTSYINYNYPCVLQTFMAYTFYIAEMDVLNSGYLLDHLEYQSGNRAFNANFQLFGVDSTQFLTNTGPILAMAVVAILHYIFCLTLLSIAKRNYKNKYFRKFAMYVDTINLTLELVKLTNEAYIDFLLGAVMALSQIMQEQHISFSHYFSTVPDVISNALTLFFLVYCLGLPLFEFAMIRYGYRKNLIMKNQFRQRFDIFYEDFKKHNIYSLQFGVFMKVRRILVVGVLIGIHVMPHIQSALLASLSLTNFMYLHTCKPYENPFDNKIELFNEAAVYFVSIFSMCFFASYPDSKMEEQFKNIVQYVVLYTIAATLAINCLVMLVHMIKDIFNSLKSRVGSCFSSASGSLKDKKRQKIYEKYPQELKYLKERELEKQNIEKCKAWKYERDWCRANGIDVSELPEEIEFQQIIKLYSFRSQKKNLEEQIEIVGKIREDKFQQKKRGNMIRKTIRESRQAKEILGKIQNKSFLHPVSALDIVRENSRESSRPSPREEICAIANSDKRLVVNEIGLIQPAFPRNTPENQDYLDQQSNQETYESPRAKVPNLETNKDKVMFHLNKNINADVLRCLNEMKSLEGQHDTNSILETLKRVRQMMVESDDDKPFVSIIDSEIEDIQNQKSTKHEDYLSFFKSLYAGRADVQHQIALKEKRDKFEFVLGSEEQEGEDQEVDDGASQESLPNLVARILFGYNQGVVEFSKSDGSSQLQAEAGLKETIQDYVNNNSEEIEQNSKVFAILSCFLEIEAYQFPTKDGLLHQIFHMETNQYENDDLVAWPLTNIKQLLRSQRQKNADPLGCIYFFIRLLHGQEKSNSLLTFQPLIQILHSFPLVAKSVEGQPAADRANLMKTLVEKYLPSSTACFNFMQIIKRKKIYYKCLCTQEQFIALSTNELEYLKIKQFYGRQKINKRSYCPKCRLNRPGHFQDTSIVFLPEILIFQSNSVLDVNLDLTEYMDDQDQIESNEVLSQLEKKTIDKLSHEIQDLESIINGTKRQDDEVSYLGKVVADFEEAISTETLQDKLQSRQDVVDHQKRRQKMVPKTTFECFSVVSRLGRDSFRSYVLRDNHWIQIEGLRTKDAGKDLQMALAQNGDESIMYQFFRKNR